MTERRSIIVVAHSARALVASAVHAGLTPLAIDVFGDCDTTEMSPPAIKLEGGLSDGMTRDKVASAVKTLVSEYDPAGLVYGSGFERLPEAIAAISLMTRIFGNDAATLERAKDPLALAQLCEVNGIRHPPIAFAPPDEPEGWLIKRRGGAGGAHVTTATRGEPAPEECYYQRRVTGQNVSALFTADGENAGIIGLSVQWSAPTQTSPFRYGGAAGPIEVGVEVTEEIARAVACITSELGLVGLNSADFLVSGDAVWLIEVNPRPGATLDVFEPNECSLLTHHITACEGRLMSVPSGLAFKAAEVVYAPFDIVSTADRNWPDWTADRPSPGTHIAANDPLCTALASGPTVDLARLRANQRARGIVAAFQNSKQ